MLLVRSGLAQLRKAFLRLRGTPLQCQPLRLCLPLLLLVSLEHVLYYLIVCKSCRHLKFSFILQRLRFLCAILLIVLKSRHILVLVLDSLILFLFVLELLVVFVLKLFLLPIDSTIQHFFFMGLRVRFTNVFLRDLVSFFGEMVITLCIHFANFPFHVLCKLYLVCSQFALVNCCGVDFVLVRSFLALELVKAHSIVQVLQGTHLGVANLLTFHFAPGIRNQISGSACVSWSRSVGVRVKKPLQRPLAWELRLDVVSSLGSC